ncbi:MAG: flagellar hook-associated protein FlgL [Gammaproteobacteria bacterium]|nr:flagellar hook-associated protein FlgL [Gammaproteobacteria bacterium]
MRIASSLYQLQWLSAIRRQQADLAVTQQQVSTGKRVNTAADDPAGVAQALLLQQGLDRLANYGVNAETARRRLALEEGALAQAGDALNRVRELALQAANSTQTDESRAAIAAEASELLKSLLNIGNAQDGEGRYLFAGNRVLERPFTLAGSVQYAGDSGVRAQRVADARTVQENDAGSAVFMQIPAGNGSFTVSANPANQGTAWWSSAAVTGGGWTPGNYTIEFTSATTWEARSGAVVLASGNHAAGDSITVLGATIAFQGEPAAGDRFTVGPAGFRDVFSTVQDFVTALQTSTGSPAGRARFQNLINSNLQNVDQALTHLGDFRSQVGARLASLDQQLENNADVQLELSRSVSAIRDTDFASAISKLELQLTSLQAAQKAYARTQAFSLFDVL